MPKQAFSVPWIRFLNSPGLLQKLLHCDHIEMLNKTPNSKNLNYQYLWKSGFEICSNRVRSPSSQVWASEKPPKLCLEVYLHSIKPLKAQVIEISNAENVIFNKNLLHCTATPTQNNENVSLQTFYPLSFQIIFNRAQNITGEAAQSGCFCSSCTVALIKLLWKYEFLQQRIPIASHFTANVYIKSLW